MEDLEVGDWIDGVLACCSIAGSFFLGCRLLDVVFSWISLYPFVAEHSDALVRLVLVWVR